LKPAMRVIPDRISSHEVILFRAHEVFAYVVHAAFKTA